MKRAERGISIIGIVVALVVVAGLVVGGLYLFSDVWRTKMKAGYDQFSKWTPENIAKDPAGYLDFCEEQTKQAQFKLKASTVAISQKKGNLESLRKDTKEKVDAGNTALDELKATWRKAETTTWPAEWRGNQVDKAACKRQIVKTAGEVESKQKLIGKYDGAIKTLQVQSEKVRDAQDRAEEQLAQIKTSREMLKVQQITDDLKNTLVAMKGVIESGVVGVANTETGSMSLDDIAAQSSAQVDESKFDEIMKK